MRHEFIAEARSHDGATLALVALRVTDNGQTTGAALPLRDGMDARYPDRLTLTEIYEGDRAVLPWNDPRRCDEWTGEPSACTHDCQLVKGHTGQHYAEVEW